MNAVATIMRNLIGLFVDDGSLAVIVLAWIALCGLTLRTIAPLETWAGPIFFIGLALILLGSALRAAKPPK